VDGTTVATGRIERTLAFRLSLDETLDCGEDTGTPVSEEYLNKMPFKFTGELKKAVIVLGKSGLTASDEKKLDEGRKLAALRD
jgi:arylsulfatase